MNRIPKGNLTDNPTIHTLVLETENLVGERILSNGLYWVGLGWVGLGWVGLGWVVLSCVVPNRSLVVPIQNANKTTSVAQKKKRPSESLPWKHSPSSRRRTKQRVRLDYDDYVPICKGKGGGGNEMTTTLQK